jgi:3-phosphoshikimate 1-carboxyvinyltransferase
VTVLERRPTRDHTEKLLAAFGADISVEQTELGRAVHLRPGRRLRPTHVTVPGDFSSAAFPLAAALVTPGSEVTIEGVLLNPLRAGLLETLGEMGADISVENERDSGGERVGDVTARHSRLRGARRRPIARPA